MTAVDDVAAQHYLYNATLIAQLTLRAQALWSHMQLADIDSSWTEIAQPIADLVTLGQYTAAAAADDYVQAAVEAQGVTDISPQSIEPSAFAGIASDGRDLAGLLLSAPLMVKTQLGAGVGNLAALLSGEVTLLMHLGTQIADAGRTADQAAMVKHPKVTTWVRVIESGACSRCAILAGREYHWDADFLRHPRCHCRAIPKTESYPRDMTTDPHRYFDSLTREQQDRLFTQAGAQAIRDGADINQVVNARRGMETVTAYGRRLQVTNEGVTRRGIAGQRELIQRNGGMRLMPEEIYRAATSRDDAIRLLREYGYTTDRSAVTTGRGVEPPVARPPAPPEPPSPGSGGAGGGERRPLVGDLIPDTLDPAELDRVEAGLRSVVDRQYGPYHMQASVDRDMTDEPGNLFWAGRILTADGDTAGFAERHFSVDFDGTLIVDHDLLSLGEEYRRKGFGPAFGAFMEQWYRESGVPAIYLHAALDDGGYVWARAGYAWRNSDAPFGDNADGVVPRLRRAIESNMGTSAERDAAEAILQRLETVSFESPAYPTPLDVAMIGWSEGRESWLGSEIMHGADWYGVKYLAP